MNQHPTNSYQSFLLRCWRPEEEQSGWRFALRTVAADPDEVSFGTVEQLLGFISAEFPTHTQDITRQAVNQRGTKEQ